VGGFRRLEGAGREVDPDREGFQPGDPQNEGDPLAQVGHDELDVMRDPLERDMQSALRMYTQGGAVRSEQAGGARGGAVFGVRYAGNQSIYGDV
jgi:hypothetical protein